MYKLYNLDAIAFLSQQGIKADLILTDLPFEVTACSWDSVIPFDKMWKGIYNIIKPNIPILLFGIEPFSSSLRLSQAKWYKYMIGFGKKTLEQIFIMRKECL